MKIPRLVPRLQQSWPNFTVFVELHLWEILEQLGVLTLPDYIGGPVDSYCWFLADLLAAFGMLIDLIEQANLEFSGVLHPKSCPLNPSLFNQPSSPTSRTIQACIRASGASHRANVVARLSRGG